MTKISLFKITTAVVYLICTPLAANAISTMCTSTKDKVYNAVTEFTAVCKNRPTCVQKALKCNSLESVVADRFSTNSSTEDDCNDIVNLACPELNLQGIPEHQANMKAANERRFEAAEDREDSSTNMADVLKQNRERQTELDKEMMALDQEYLEERQKMSEELQNAMEGIDAEKANAIIEAQKAYDQLDQEYIAIRRDLRDLESQVSLLKGRMESDCAAAAHARAKAVEGELNKYLGEAGAAAKRTNISMRYQAGSKKRRQKWVREKITFEYADFHKNCRLALIDPGLNISNSLKEAQHKLFNGQAQAADKAAAMEKQRLQIQENLKGLDASSQKKIQGLMQKQQQRLALLDRSRMNNMMILQKSKMDAQADLATQMALNGGQFQGAAQEGVNAGQDALNAGTRMRCEHADTESQASQENFDKIYGAIRKVESMCTDVPGACSEAADKATRDGLNGLCSKYQEASTSAPSAVPSESVPK